MTIPAADPNSATVTGGLRTEILVIGSGPGGAISAALLAEAGRKVLLVEEGPFLPLDSCAPFSIEEMVQKYRNGGLTPSMGQPKVAYVEGRCVGGGSEINSGLYHRTPPEILERWSREFELEAVDESSLAPLFAANESDVCVSYLPGTAPAASLKLHQGASTLGWKSLEVPRWFRYGANSPEGLPTGRRQTMTETFIPRFLAAGGHLLSDTRIWKLRRDGDRWTAVARDAFGQEVRIEAEVVFVCGGAIQSAALLRRSGIVDQIGNALQMHPTAKAVACFNYPVNQHGMGVPVHQVKEFSPEISLGCSISSPAYINLALLDHPAWLSEARRWEHHAVYYAMISPSATGRIRNLPGFRDPLVTLSLLPSDRVRLATGLRHLCEALFASGASAIYPGLADCPRLRSADDLFRLPGSWTSKGSNLMTIHLFSSCPMGENRKRCAVNSFGKVFNQPNLFLSDASTLCTAPGVNPQGSVMAFARRNALKFLGRL